MNACRICHNTEGNKVHAAREMMFGFRDRFDYLECAQCGCVQLLSPPRDMGRYYPRDYYSYRAHGWAMTILRHQWSAYAFGRTSALGRLISTVYFPNWALRSLRRMNPPMHSSILDVGCGSGHLLLDLQHFGFRNLAGVDPFLEKQLEYEGGLIIYKKQLDQLADQYDIIMLHHAFEHMDNPAGVMQSLARLLRPRGTIILRIPIASSYAWKHYGVNWFGLDAPRHLFLHTTSSITELAARTGLVIREAAQEAAEGVLWASEAYAQDIPMSDPRFPFNGLLKRLWGWRKLREYRLRAQELCQINQADMVCFYLSKASQAGSES